MSFYAVYPSVPNPVPTYANLAAFPSAASAGNGALAIALDTDTLYISTGAAWIALGGPGAVLSIGTFDSGVASANGAHIDSNALIMQSASATVPGLVNTSTQTLAGAKTFSTAPILSSLTASLPLQLDGSKNITALAIDLSTSQVTGVLAINKGGTGQTTASAAFNALSPITTTGDMIYSASGATNSRLAIGGTGNVLTVTGGIPVWAAPATSGTVTSVAMTVPTFLSISGSPITSAGTLAVTVAAGNSGGILGYTGTTTLTSSAALTVSQLIIGGGAGATPTTLAAGSQYQVLVMGATIPGYGQLNLGQSAAVTGTLLAAQFPALTSDVTTTAGSLATSLVATSNGTLTTLSALVSVGTITTGTWSATAIAINKGGTGQTTASAAFNALSPITTTGDMIYSASGATNSRLAIGGTGNVLTVTGGIPVWAAPATSGTVTSVAMTVPTFLSISGSPITSSGTLAVTLSGTALPIANGGTAVTSVTVAPAATAFAGWDANKNLSANATLDAYTTVVTANQTTTLLVGSTKIQYFTGSTTSQIVQLPVTSTLVLGQRFHIVNTSSVAITVNSSGSNLVQTMAANTYCIVTCILVTGTTAASWSVFYTAAPTTITGTGSLVLATSPTLVTPLLGTPTSGNLSNCTNVSLTAGVTGTLPVGNGGTGVTSSTGSTNVVLSGSPTIVTPAIDQINESTSTNGVAIMGRTSGTAVSSGNIGQAPTKQTGTVTSTTTFAQWATMTLTAGIWFMTGSASAQAGAATGSYIQLCIATTGGNSTAGTTLGYDNVYGGVNATAGTGQACIPGKYVNISASTSYFLNGRSDHVTGSDIAFSMQAIRIG